MLALRRWTRSLNERRGPAEYVKILFPSIFASIFFAFSNHNTTVESDESAPLPSCFSAFPKDGVTRPGFFTNCLSTEILSDDFSPHPRSMSLPSYKNFFFFFSYISLRMYTWMILNRCTSDDTVFHRTYSCYLKVDIYHTCLFWYFKFPR